MVPAWSARPAKSIRQRPCGQIDSATPTAASIPARALPCSTCSSMNASMPAIRSASGPIAAGSNPACVMAAARSTPSPSVSSRAASGAIAPVSSRLPRQETPNLAPSSSVNATTPTGLTGTCPASASRSIATNAETTPSGPSNGPPSGTESRWLPVTIAPAPSAGFLGGIPPGPQIAVLVGLEAKTASLGFAAEPVAAAGLGGRKRKAPVAARLVAPAERQERLPQRQLPRGSLAHGCCSPIGTRTCRSAATSRARS